MNLDSKKHNYKHYTLGIANGVTLTLVVPSRWNRDKYPKYYIQYGKQKFHELVKHTYLKCQDYIKSLDKPSNEDKQQAIMDSFQSHIQMITANLQTVADEDRVTLNTNVLIAINSFFSSQTKSHQIGELVDISDYTDRNKKLNDYFSLKQNQLMTLRELNKEVWVNFRYFLLENYKIKANTTVNQYMVYVKSFYNWLMIDKEVMLPNHPLQLKKLNKNTPDKYEDIGTSTAYNLIETLANDERYLRLYIIALLVYENGKRPIQAYTLKHENIDLDNRTLFLQPKSRSKNLEITMITEELANAIKKIYDNTEKAGQMITNDSYLLGGYNCFKPSGSKPATQGDIRDGQIVKFKKDYPEFKDVKIYSLKHTSLTAVSQIDIKKAQRMANHSKQSTTEEHYDKSRRISQAVSRKDLLAL